MKDIITKVISFVLAIVALVLLILIYRNYSRIKKGLDVYDEYQQSQVVSTHDSAMQEMWERLHDAEGRVQELEGDLQRMNSLLDQEKSHSESWRQSAGAFSKEAEGQSSAAFILAEIDRLRQTIVNRPYDFTVDALYQASDKIKRLIKESQLSPSEQGCLLAKLQSVIRMIK